SSWTMANTTSTVYVDIPGMSLTIVPAITAWFQILVQINGVQAYKNNAGQPQAIGAYFQLLVDGNWRDFTRQEFHYSGWELRGVTLSRLMQLNPGTHIIKVQWYVAAAAPDAANTLQCSWYGDQRSIQVIEL